MKKIVAILLQALFVTNAMSQSVGIGTTSPNVSAVLDINSSNKGMLVPRMTTTQRNAIASPAKGLLVFDSTRNSYWHYTGTAWKEIGNTYSADNTLTYGGNVFSYNMTSPTQQLSSVSGFLYDSGGPTGNYANNESKEAYIASSYGHLATDIVVMSNSLESPYDSLILEDNYGHRYVLLGTTTGTFRLFGYVTIKFISNFANTQAGFALRWDKIYSSFENQYDANQLTGWYFNSSEFYMRGGVNIGNSWSPDSSGEFSFVHGRNSVAKGTSSYILGDENIATDYYSLAIGYRNRSTEVGTIAIGSDNLASDYHAISLGVYNKSTGASAFTAGFGNTASGNYAVAMGSTNTALGSNSTVFGYDNSALGPYTTVTGISNKAKSYGGTIVGVYNDTSNAITPFYTEPSNRLFEVGNGDFATRRNAMTVLYNGNVGLGVSNPNQNLVVANSIRLDDSDGNNGTTVNSLFFGNGSTGEAIASKRTDGGNRWGLDFYTNNINRMSISNTGVIAMSNALNVNGNITVQNGKGIVRSSGATQQKIQTVTVPVSVTLAANSTTSIIFTWPESFTGSPVGHVGNVTSGSGGWAEVVTSLGSLSATGGTLYVFNPRGVSASINFNLVIIGIGGQ